MADSLSLGALLGAPGQVPGFMNAAAGATEGSAPQGLFQSLVADAEATDAWQLAPVTEAKPAAIVEPAIAAAEAKGATPTVATAPENTSAAPAPVTLDVPLTEAGITVQVGGELVAVQVLVQRLTVLYHQLTVEGGLTLGKKGPTGDLANALTQLGMPADEAQALATRIETMMTLLNQQLGLSTPDEATGLGSQQEAGLAAVLLASILTPAQAQTLQLPAGQSVQTQLQVSVTQVQVTLTRSAWAGVQARAQSTPDTLAVLQPEGAPAPAAMPIMLARTPVSEASLAVSLQVAATPAGQAETTLQLPLPGALAAQVKNGRTAPASGPVEAVAAPTVSTGTTLYRLLETADGQAQIHVLTPSTPSVGSGAENLTEITFEQPPVSAHTVANATALPTTLTSAAAAAEAVARPDFAARLEQAYQAQAARQVQLAIQPLLLNGQGGTVHMTLNPPELGRLEIHLRIENGQVQGTISAQEPAVVENLARELPTLRQSFLDAGLKIGDQGLSLMLGQQQSNDQQPNARNPFAGSESGNRNSATSTDGTDYSDVETLAPNAPRWMAPTQLLDVDA